MRLVLILLLKAVFFVFALSPIRGKVIKKVTHKINTTECSWKIRGVRRFYANITMHQFLGSSFNHGPHVYGVCTFRLLEPLHINRSSTVNISGRHSLAIQSKYSIEIFAPFVLDWSPEKMRSDMWLGGFCSRDGQRNITNGYGPGGGSCYGSAGHGGMGIDIKRGIDDVKYGWRYGVFNGSDIALIGGSSGGVTVLGSGYSCGGGAIRITSDTSVTIDATISTNAFTLAANDSCIFGGSGGTIIIEAKMVNLTSNARLLSRGAPGIDNTICDSYSGSGGVIVVNRTITDNTPDPVQHTGPETKDLKRKSYGVVMINGVSKDRLPRFTKWNADFKGCYSRNEMFNYSILPDYLVQPWECRIQCTQCGYRYAILHVKACACVDFLDEMTAVGDSNCSLRCFSFEEIKCGGGNETNTFYTVYKANRTGTANKISNISTPMTCPRRQASPSHCNFRPTWTTLAPATLTTLTSSTSGFQKPSKLQDLSQIPVTKNNSAKILEELSNITTTAVDSLGPNELNLSLSIFEKIVKEDAINTKNKTESERVGQLVLNIADSLLNSSESSWSVIEKEEKRSPEILLKLVEQASGKLGKSLDANDTLSLNSSNFGLRIERVDPAQFNNRTFIFSGLDIEETDIKNAVNDKEEFVFLPASLSEAMHGAGPFNLNLLKYHPHPALVNASLKNSTARSLLASNIIAISVSRPLKKELNDKVILNFPQSKIVSNDAKKSCRFLDFEETLDVSWSTRGCVVGSNKEGRIECLCNHFTSFAVLTTVQQAPVDKVHIEALSWLTYLGCTISLICLIITLTTFAVLETLVCDHIWIHCNLIVSLILAQLVFIFGIKATDIKIVCQGISMSLHYLYTAAIFWMCIEGIHMYRKVVNVFMKSSVKKYYYILGWGGPAFIVFISALLRFDGFGSEKACWLSIEKGLIWAFVVPVLVVFLINLIILLLVVRIMLVSLNTIPSPNGPKSSIRNGVKGVIFLLPILGLTWVLGVVAVNSANVVFQYIFTILNSFQGFFIFLFHCLLNKDVRAAVKKRRERKTTIQRWSNVDSSWKSKDTLKSTLQSSRLSKKFVNKVDVEALPDPPRSADSVK